MKKLNLFNKTAVISGASSGIGKELSLYLIKNFNVKVYAVSRTYENLISVKESLGSLKDNYIPTPFDVSVKENWQNFQNSLNGEQIDILINCAGILPKFAKFENLSLEEFERVISVNFASAVYSIKILQNNLKLSSTPLIINVSSSSALCPFSNVSSYSSSKSALERFSECLSVESNYTVVTALPGFTSTNVMKEQNFNEKQLKLINKISANSEKVAKKIIVKSIKRKRRIIIGFDAKLMNLLYKLFPKTAPKIISRFLKKTNFDAFKDF